MRTSIGFGISLAIALAVPGIARAQAATSAASGRAVTGVVRDATGRPIEGVEVRMDARPVAITDSAGLFRIGIAGGATSLAFRRLGYEPATRAIAPTDTATVDVVLVPNSQLLRTIVVEGRAYDRELWANGFYHRRKIASGSFFDPDYLAHFGGNGVASLLHEVPRVDVERKGNRDYAFSTVAGNRCRMNVYIDGVFQQVAMPGPRVGGDDAVGLSDLVDYRDIHAIEVYPRAMSVPTQFTRIGPGSGPQGRPMPRIPSPRGQIYTPPPSEENADAACGAIVIWTRTPGER